MIYFILILAIIFILIVFFSIFGPIKQKNNFENNLKAFLEKENVNFSLSKNTIDPYDYDLEIENQKYLLKTISIPAYADVQINNKTTWEIKYGAGPTPGKAQPHKKFLTCIAPFMNYNQKDAIKVVVIIPASKQTVMYINECEIIFVDHTTNVYGTRVINCNDFSLFQKQK